MKWQEIMGGCCVRAVATLITNATGRLPCTRRWIPPASAHLEALIHALCATQQAEITAQEISLYLWSKPAIWILSIVTELREERFVVMDIAFGVVGVVGVATQLFQSITTSYGILSTAKHLEQDTPILLWKLKIQEARFLMWGRYFGAESGRLDDMLRENGLLDMVVGVLRQAEMTLGRADTLKSRYGIFCLTSSTPPEAFTSANIQQPTMTTKARLSSKFRWAISDKAKFASLLNDMKDFNDGLHGILRLNESTAIDRIIQSSVLRNTDKALQVEYVRDACDEFKKATSAASPKLSLLYSSMKVSAQSKLAMISSLGEGALHLHQRRPRSSIEIPAERTRSEFRTMGRYDPLGKGGSGGQASKCINVLIEWKEFDPESPVKGLIDQRVNCLTELLSPNTPKPPDFRTLDCLGFFEDDEFPRYGIIYQVPQACRKQAVSLHNLVGKFEDKYLPDLGDKFAFATTLSVALLRLHDSGWVHGSLRSNNIIFLVEEEDEKIARHLRDPYIVGFTFSRPTDSKEVTLDYSMMHFEHDLYRHPQIAQFASRKILRDPADRQRFQTIHDLYALGIILLELGLWRDVFTLWKEKYTHGQFQEKLINAYVPRLGPKMGTIYRDTVKELLTLSVSPEDNRALALSDTSLGYIGTDIIESNGPTESPNHTEFYWKVVEKLAQCKV